MALAQHLNQKSVKKQTLNKLRKHREVTLLAGKILSTGIVLKASKIAVKSTGRLLLILSFNLKHRNIVIWYYTCPHLFVNFCLPTRSTCLMFSDFPVIPMFLLQIVFFQTPRQLHYRTTTSWPSTSLHKWKDFLQQLGHFLCQGK